MINTQNSINNPDDLNNIYDTGKVELTVGGAPEIHAKTLKRIDMMFEPHIDNTLMLDLRSALVKLADEGLLCE